MTWIQTFDTLIVFLKEFFEKVNFEKKSADNKNSEYDQEIPQSQTADNPMAPRGRAAQPSRDTRKTIKQSNQLSLPHQDDCNTRMEILITFANSLDPDQDRQNVSSDLDPN